MRQRTLSPSAAPSAEAPLARAILSNAAGPPAKHPQTGVERRQRAEVARRQEQWTAAGRAADAAGIALTTTISFTWHALSYGDRREGNILHLSERDRVKQLWDRLRRLLLKHGIGFYAARAPEHDREKGVHLHLSVHVPGAALPDVVALVERLTGSPRDFFRAPGSANFDKAVRWNGRKVYGAVARSFEGGWLIQQNTRPGAGGSEGIMHYITKAPRSQHVASQFRLSNALIALVQAQNAPGL